MNIKVKLDPTQKILLKRQLNSNGKAQKFFTSTVRRHYDKFVPFLSGNLAHMSVREQDDKIIHNAPYAADQYYKNAGFGQDGTEHGGLRGKLWDKRMMANEGDQVVKEVADFVGGKAKK